MNDPETVAADFDPRQLPNDFFDNPYPYYRALREFDPVHRCPDGSWFITRYADNLAVYRDHHRLSSDKRVEFSPKFGETPLYGHLTNTLVFRDPPYHTTVRKLIHHFFSPRALSAMEPRLVKLVDGLLDTHEQSGQFDLIGDYAFALPVEVVCDLLGIPRSQEDRVALRGWAKLILGALEPVLDEAFVVQANQAVEDFSAYLGDLVARKRRRGASDEVDVLSVLVAAMDKDKALTEHELIQNCIFFLNAGHETTTNLIGNGVNALLEHPSQLARLLDEAALLPTAIDEFLRFEASNQLGNRRALEKVQIGEQTLPAGALITLCIGAANRDPQQFPNAEELDVGRIPNRHLSFAAGIHTCAGAALARLEGRVAIGRLLSRFPDLHRLEKPARDRRIRFRVMRSMRVGV